MHSHFRMLYCKKILNNNLFGIIEKNHIKTLNKEILSKIKISSISNYSQSPCIKYFNFNAHNNNRLLSTLLMASSQQIFMQNFHTCIKNNSESQKIKNINQSSSLNVRELLMQCYEKLKSQEIDEAQLHAECILSHALGINRNELSSTLENSVEPEIFEDITKMMHCRLARMPLQYIVGNWEFHCIKLNLRPPVFIPRAETEGLVNISAVVLKDVENPVVLDIGCGSGAISLALLNTFPNLNCVGIDQSKYAKELTLENAKNLNLNDRLDFVQGKITGETFPLLPYEKFDLIVSNPPYVLRKDLIDLQPEITLYEDLRALDGGKEGLDVISNIILHGQHKLKDGGCILMEIDPCHRYLLPVWMEKNKTRLKISQFYHDINGVHRYVKLVVKE